MKAANLLIYENKLHCDFYNQCLIGTGLTTDLFRCLYVIYLRQPVKYNHLYTHMVNLTVKAAFNKMLLKRLLVDYIYIDDFNIVRCNSEGVRLCILYEEFIDSYVEYNHWLFK